MFLFLKGDVQNCPLCKRSILDAEFTFPAFDAQSMILNQNQSNSEIWLKFGICKFCFIYTHNDLLFRKKNAEMKCGPVHNSIIRNCKFFWSLCSKKYRSKLSRLNFMGLKFIILHVWTSRDWHIKSPRHFYVRQCRLLFE